MVLGSELNVHQTSSLKELVTAKPSENVLHIMKGPRISKFEHFLTKYQCWKTGIPGINYHGNENSHCRNQPLDFTFGNPQYEASTEYVRTLQESADPKGSPGYFGYRFGSNNIRKLLQARLIDRYELDSTDLDYRNITLTTGAIAGLALCLHVTVNPGDEVIYCTPGWILYEALIHSCNGIPVAVRMDTSSNSKQASRSDMERIISHISDRTKAVIINTPHNPTGRMYSEEDIRYLCMKLKIMSTQRNSPIFLISDEPYSDIVLDDDGKHFSPFKCYEFCMLVYSYGKVLLAPSQRIGYVLLSSHMPGVKDMSAALETAQFVYGYCVPNALMQESYEKFEDFRDSFSTLEYRESRDVAIAMLRSTGFRVNLFPQSTFYVVVESPLKDDDALCDMLQQEGLLVLPGSVLGAPGTFRLTLVARSDRINLARGALTRVMAQVEKMSTSERVY